ncbi:helix-turn-helix transcriptional regulator [bacterium]|nr:helix-turn-helix transcriptional regulator [bacterium]MDE6224212.1 helix-turn-helix transcriptional regulator [Alphaproteobacteria bacterium]
MTKSIFTNNYQLLLKLLVETRKKAGITQQELAKKLGKNQSYISKYENSERRLDMIEVIAIVKAMGANPSDLMQNILKEWKE